METPAAHRGRIMTGRQQKPARPELSHLNVETFVTREEWLAARRAPDTIGASEAAAVLGVSPFMTAWSFWEMKRHPQSEKRSEVLQRGHRWEPAVIAEYQDESEHEVLTPGEAVRSERDALVTLSNPRIPFIRQSPDSFALDRGTLGQVEAKTALQAGVWSPEPGIVIDRWDDAHADLIPPHYAVQGYVQLIVTELDWVDLCALVPKGRWLGVRWVRLMRDVETQQQIEAALTEFRARHLIAGEPPALDGSDACNRYLARKHPSLAGKEKPWRHATIVEARKMVELADIRAKEKVLKARADLLRNELIESAQGRRLVCSSHPKGPYGQPQNNEGRVTLDMDRLRREVAPDVMRRCEKQGAPFASFVLYRDFEQVRAALAAVDQEESNHADANAEQGNQ